MSYTTFSLSGLKIIQHHSHQTNGISSSSSSTYTVSTSNTSSLAHRSSLATALVKIKNTGKVAGAETLQLYILAPNSPTQRPVKELHGFEKVFLQPGEEQEVTIEIDSYATSFWDESEEKWCTEEGEYKVLVATSGVLGAEGSVEAKLNVEDTKWWLGL